MSDRPVPALMAALCLAGAAPPAATGSPRTVTVEADPRYRAGWLFRLFFGSQWRDAWTTPIEVPVLDLQTFDGGLRPVRRGGGLQTMNLRLESGDRHVWVFRSVNKDSTRVLDPETRKSVIGDIFQDLTSTQYPGGAVVVASLLEAVGILHSTPQLAVVPDDPRLGEFRDFAGMLASVEQRIERDLPGVRKVEDTTSLFARLEQRSDEHVDARDYLRARLVDMLVNDWDRHVDQWRWVRFDQRGERIWRPVPRDRDQAFSRFDGFFPAVSQYYTKQLASFRTSYSAIDKLTFSGRYTDRRFLVGLEKPEWDAVTAEVVAKLTDAVISDAVHRLLPPLYAQTGADLERTLRARRDGLAEASHDFYRLLAERVDVRGTEGDEYVEVKRNPGGAVEVSVFQRDEKTGEKASAPFYRRTFLAEETEEIRLYTLGGKDRVVVEGDADRTITLRIVAPSGTAEVVDRSKTPSATTVYQPHEARPPATEAPEDPEVAAELAYQPTRDWGSDLLFFPQLSYDSTRGLVPGVSAQLTRFGFQLDPYASQMNFGAAWSTGTNRPRLEYGADLRTRSPVRGLVYLAYSGMDVVRFFGIGNQTPRDSKLASAGFYDVNQEQLLASPMLEVPLVGPLRSRLGVLLKHVSNVQDAGIIRATGAYGSSAMTLASGELDLLLDTRTGALSSLRGVSLLVSGRHTPRLFSNAAAFSKLRGEVSADFGAHILTDVFFSLRAAAERNWGRYPFFEAAFIGGIARRWPLDLTNVSSGSVLRGYDLNRFAGDSSLAGNAELRIALGRYSAILPLRYGLLGLGDVGRVFVAGESSSRWHTGVGGGVWFALFASGPGFKLASSLSAALVRSDEGTSFYLLSGFGL